MSEMFKRTELLLGEMAMEILSQSRVAVFGVGGVGGYAVEALTRSGVGAIDVFDNDVVCQSNINRQIIATTATIGELKVNAAAERARLINPCVRVTAHNMFYTADSAAEVNFSDFDYVIDAIDTVTSKIDLIVRSQENNVPIISSMGAGNKIDPTRFEVDDIYNTSVCPLARVMRCELKRRRVERLKVVYSKEKPIKPPPYKQQDDTRRQTPGSCAFVPSVVGLIIAGEVIKDLIKQ